MADLLAEILAALDVPAAPEVDVVGEGVLGSAFRVGDLAVASLAAAGVCLAQLVDAPRVRVDQSGATHWFGMSIRPMGWRLPDAWDAVAGDYPAADGWIRLHTNAPHHRAAALRVLDVTDGRDAVAAAVARWPAHELEQAVVAAGGAAAAMLTIAEWHRHPQGRAVRAEPLVAHADTPGAAPQLRFEPDRPLRGVRVLDLTRVLAGPAATRLLAGWGADVLRIDPPSWDEPAVVPEMLLGKRTARLDLTAPDDRGVFQSLLEHADVLVSGYRSDALERLGFGADARAAIRPGLVDVAVDAYGWTGPWRTRRGFDSLVQMSTGIAAAGMRAYGRDRPTPLPVQALDHAAGYLAAAAALAGLRRRQAAGCGSAWRVSLARTAQFLIDAGPHDVERATGLAEPQLSEEAEQTSWGPARRLRPPLLVPGAALRWALPARALGVDEPVWSSRR